MKKKYLLWLAICVAALALACAACGDAEEPAADPDGPAVTVPAVPDTDNGGLTADDEAAASLLGVRQLTLDSGCACAVAFVDYVDISGGGLAVDPDYQAFLLEESGYAQAYPFVKELSGAQVVETKFGQELYCVVPLDVNATLAVNALDGNGEVSEVLYRAESGDPILLRCDGYAGQVSLNVVGTEGEITEVTGYVPRLDDSGALAAGTGVYDFSLSGENGIR